MRVVLIRHGLTRWNEHKRIQGQTDTSLSDAGRAQVSRWRLPAQLQSQRWYVSPLRRARQTADLLGCPAACVEPRLIEMHWGAWEGASLPELRSRLGDRLRDEERRGLDFRPPGGESPRDVQHRVLRWCAELSGVAGEVVAVTHKGVIRAVYAAAVEWDMRHPPVHELQWQSGHIFRVHRDGRVSVSALNVSLRG